MKFIKTKGVMNLLALAVLMLGFFYLFPNNIFVVIATGFILVGIVWKSTYVTLFYLALTLLLIAPILWIIELEEQAEKIADFAYFFLLAGTVGSLLFETKRKEKKSTALFEEE